MNAMTSLDAAFGTTIGQIAILAGVICVGAAVLLTIAWTLAGILKRTPEK